MERTGDVYIKLISMEELPKLFGPENYHLLNILLDHANSNNFFETITKHYNLEDRVSWYPSDNNHESSKWRADIFEAWVGGYIYERRQYDPHDPLEQLRVFLKRLWAVRYRDLSLFSYNPSINPKYIPRGYVKQVQSTRVKFSQDPLLRNVLGSFVDAPNAYMDAGYLVRLEISEQPEVEGNTRMFETFCISSDEVQKIQGLRMWNAPRIYPSFHESNYRIYG